MLDWEVKCGGEKGRKEEWQTEMLPPGRKKNHLHLQFPGSGIERNFEHLSTDGGELFHSSPRTINNLLLRAKTNMHGEKPCIYAHTCMQFLFCCIDFSHLSAGFPDNMNNPNIPRQIQLYPLPVVLPSFMTNMHPHNTYTLTTILWQLSRGPISLWWYLKVSKW